MRDKIEHLLNGHALVDAENNAHRLNSFSLYAVGAGPSIIDITIDLLDSLSVKLTPEQQRIKELEEEVERLKAKQTPRRTPTTIGLHKVHTHLSEAEVHEIEDLFQAFPDSSYIHIASTYDISHPTVSRIHTGQHAKSSSSYKAFIKEQRS